MTSLNKAVGAAAFARMVANALRFKGQDDPKWLGMVARLAVGEGGGEQASYRLAPQEGAAQIGPAPPCKSCS